MREREAGLDGVLKGLIGKLPGVVMRIALVLRLLDWATNRGPAPTDIAATTLKRALRLTEDYFLPMAERCYSPTSVPVVDRQARRLLIALKQRNAPRFSTRDIIRGAVAGIERASDLNPVLERLTEAGLIRQSPAASTGIGRPARRYEINPLLLAKTHQAG